MKWNNGKTYHKDVFKLIHSKYRSSFDFLNSINRYHTHVHTHINFTATGEMLIESFVLISHREIMAAVS